VASVSTASSGIVGLFMTLLPQLPSNIDRIGLEIIPPSQSVPGMTDFAIMQSADRDDRFVTDFHADRSRLSKRNVMWPGSAGAGTVVALAP
jgi:hypothetical protein